LIYFEKGIDRLLEISVLLAVLVQVERGPGSAPPAPYDEHIGRVDVEENEGARAARVHVPLVHLFHRVAAELGLVADLGAADQADGRLLGKFAAVGALFVQVVAEQVRVEGGQAEQLRKVVLIKRQLYQILYYIFLRQTLLLSV
jgi:hypothetical protein